MHVGGGEGECGECMSDIPHGLLCGMMEEWRRKEALVNKFLEDDYQETNLYR